MAHLFDTFHFGWRSTGWKADVEPWSLIFCQKSNILSKLANNRTWRLLTPIKKHARLPGKSGGYSSGEKKWEINFGLVRKVLLSNPSLFHHHWWRNFWAGIWGRCLNGKGVKLNYLFFKQGNVNSLNILLSLVVIHSSHHVKIGWYSSGW